MTDAQATDIARIEACLLLRLQLHGHQTGARLKDARALAQLTFALAGIAEAAIRSEAEQSGRTADETRDDATAWLDAQINDAETRLLESGIVLNPAALTIVATCPDCPDSSPEHPELSEGLGQMAQEDRHEA